MPLTRQQFLSRCDLVLVGGVPGAGKSTAIRTVDRHPAVSARDPEFVQHRLAQVIPAAVPYRRYRPLVHLIHNLSVVADLLAGPRPGRTLVVHDPGTGRHRRPLFTWLARRRGWRTVALWVDVDRQSARDGQLQRGRIVGAGTFDRHWLRWELLRTALPTDLVDEGSDDAGEAAPVVVVERTHAAAVLARLCGVRLVSRDPEVECRPRQLVA